MIYRRLRILTSSISKGTLTLVFARVYSKGNPRCTGRSAPGEHACDVLETSELLVSDTALHCILYLKIATALGEGFMGGPINHKLNETVWHACSADAT